MKSWAALAPTCDLVISGSFDPELRFILVLVRARARCDNVARIDETPRILGAVYQGIKSKGR